MNTKLEDGSETIQFNEIYKIAMYSLKINGSHPSGKRDKIWFIRSCIFIIFPVVTVTYFIGYSIIVHIKNKEFGEVARCFSNWLVFSTVILKYISLMVYRKSIRMSIEYVQNDYDQMNTLSEEDRATVYANAKQGVYIIIFWLIAAGGTALTFPGSAFIRMLYSLYKGNFRLVPVTELTLPEPLQSIQYDPPVFWSLFYLCSNAASVGATMFAGFDPLVPIFMLHVCSQLTLLNRRMMRVFADVKNLRHIRAELKIIVVKLQSLYLFMDRIKKSFATLNEYNYQGTAVMLPFTAFKILEDLKNKECLPEFYTFFVGAVVHVLCPCYYSDLLMDTSEDFRMSIYSSGWETCPNKSVRQTILCMITRAKFPMGIRTVFTVINLDAFAEMCRKAYSLFNLMNAAWS